jgi:hypothetical protein
MDLLFFEMMNPEASEDYATVPWDCYQVKKLPGYHLNSNQFIAFMFTETKKNLHFQFMQDIHRVEFVGSE